MTAWATHRGRNRLIVLAVLVAVLMCMIFMPGMAMLIVAAGVAVALFVVPRRSLGVALRASFKGSAPYVRDVFAAPIGRDPPRPLPLRL